jgi:beta-carotene ketolase (CrtW type)
MGIGKKIKRNPQWALSHRVIVSPLEKLLIACSSLFATVQRELLGLGLSLLILMTWFFTVPVLIFTQGFQNQTFLQYFGITDINQTVDVTVTSSGLLPQLIYFLARSFHLHFFWTSIAFILLNIFLFTGLFIISHDALHFNISKRFRWINLILGRSSLFLYGAFSYTKMQPKHHDHHQYTATNKDPDFHDLKNIKFWPWYFKFMREYSRWPLFLFYQSLTMLVYFTGNSIAFFLSLWALPAILSSVQLFYFGTYLTHKKPQDGYNRLSAKSNDYPLWLSILTCYNFGYHFEHHDDPSVPWWALRRYQVEK